MIPNSDSERTNAEVSAWLARFQAGDVSASDKQTFYNWLTADPAHATAFEKATNLWKSLGDVPRSAYFPEAATPRPNRRALIAASVGLVICGGLPFLREEARAQTFKTAVGEKKHIVLPDGTKLLLDTDTSVSVDLRRGSRTVDLQYGRINCHVAPDNRQFVVKAAERVISGDAPIFDLYDVDKYFSLVLIEGTAVVNSKGRQIVLSAGERAVAREAQPLHCDWPIISSLTAWQTGRLIFQDETVSDAVKEMNRYSTIRLEIDDPGLASQRISGGYKVGDSAQFAETLTHLFSIKIRETSGAIKLVSSTAI